MNELLELVELEPRWRELKSTLGRQMFYLAEIRRDFRALNEAQQAAHAIPSEAERFAALGKITIKREQLTARRRELRTYHRSDRDTYQLILRQFEKMGKDMTSKVRRSQNGTTAELPKPELHPSPDPRYSQSGSGGYC